MMGMKMMGMKGPPLGKMAPAIGAAPGAKSPKPQIRMRHIKLGGKSAFPAAPTAFGPPAGDGPQAPPAYGDAAAGAGPGDAGA
jgi:hypothetical protein